MVHCRYESGVVEEACGLAEETDQPAANLMAYWEVSCAHESLQSSAVDLLRLDRRYRRCVDHNVSVPKHSQLFPLRPQSTALSADSQTCTNYRRR